MINHFNKNFKLNEEEKQLWKIFSQAESDSSAQAAFDKILDLHYAGIFQWILRYIKSREISAHIMKESSIILLQKRRVFNTTDTELRNFFRSVLIAWTIREIKNLAEEWFSMEDKEDVDFWKWAEERKINDSGKGKMFLSKRT